MLHTLDDTLWLEPPDYSKNAIYECYLCGRYIFENDVYYKFEEKIYCEICVEDYFKHYA